MRERRTASLRARIALAATAAATLVGLVAAGSAALLVDRLDEAAQDRRLTDAAVLIQRQIDSEGGDPRKHVTEEAAEVAPIGLRMALFENGSLTAGAAEVIVAAEEGCASRTDAAGQWRTCVVGAPERRVVVTALRDFGSARSRVLLLAIAAATILAALVSVLLSRALARWSLQPLTELGARIERIKDHAGDADLGPPSGLEEVETLRHTVRGLLDRLGEAIERSRGFAASAAHELRTPLATMIAELELASESSPATAESLLRVRRTAGRLTVLIERLLLIASGGASALVLEDVALEDVVRETIAGRAEPERARVEASYRASGMVRGDDALLRIVIDNLIDNALKYAPGAPVRVVVTEEAGEVVVTVSDEGPGIDPDGAERLFLPFARGRDAAVPGHGLGLAIVADAARLHGGDVRFVARPVGTEVRITLPSWSAAAR